MSSRNVVDLSGSLEYLADADNADFFAPAIEAPDTLIIPSSSLLEVFKWVLRERGEDAALQAATLVQQGTVVDLDVAEAIRRRSSDWCTSFRSQTATSGP